LPPIDDRWPVQEVVEPTPVETVVPINEWVSTSVEEPVSISIEDPVSLSVEVPVPVSAPAPAPVPLPVEDEPEPETVIGNPRAPVAHAQRSELEFLDEPDPHDTGSQAPLFEPAVHAD